MSPASIALIVVGAIAAASPVAIALRRRRFVRAGLALILLGGLWGGAAYANFGTARRNKDITMALLLTAIGAQFGAFLLVTPQAREVKEP